MRTCPKELFDGVTDHQGRRYFITHECADRIWKQNETFFNSFDGYIVSDTTPLSRIFLQNAPEKPLIIWICNRFDFPWSVKLYARNISYYNEIQRALTKPNVAVIAYTPYEIIHAKYNRNVFGIQKLIKPTGGAVTPHYQNIFTSSKSSCIPKHIDRSASFFVRDYANENNLHIETILSSLEIPFYKGPYAGASDLNGFKGLIHIPFVMSNLFLFESLALGIVPLIPSKTFLKTLIDEKRCDFCFSCKPQSGYEDIFLYSEWYAKEFESLFVYFDSWNDLKEKTLSLDFKSLSSNIKLFSEKHQKEMLTRWSQVFTDLGIISTL